MSDGPVRIFIGASANGEDAESIAVLQFSVLKHTTRPVEFVVMAQTNDPSSFWHGWATERWATPFSGYRWGVPAFCGYQGKAIYTDSDVIFLDDVAKLWDQPIPPGRAVLAKSGSWRLCVSLWDCAAARDVLPPIDTIRHDPASHKRCSDIMRAPNVRAAFAGNWNCLDGEGRPDLEDGSVQALHYTDMSCQPHLAHALPRLAASGQRHWFDGTLRPHPRPDVQALFDRYLAEAIAAGITPDQFIPAEPFGDYQKQSLTNYRGRA